ncbi:MAG: hypothetical protein IKT55_01745 [Clostridia bacterium]|nr:hypothetical protein [Clostridia bacterium]
MKVIICLDDNGGMLFNNRRQSRDKEVLKDVFNNLEGEKLYISPFSQKLFEEFSDRLIIDDALLLKAQKKDTCFIENKCLKGVLDINEIIVYKWNRIYPSDFKCDVDFSNYTLTETVDFKGFSHEKITKETYKR